MPREPIGLTSVVTGSLPVPSPTGLGRRSGHAPGAVDASTAEWISRGDWLSILHRRWRFGEHISLGELRVVVWIARLLAATPFAHGHRVLNLEDNWATSGSCRKGRSCSNSLNFLLRKRTASTLASETSLHLPWVQTDVQPADEATRTC